MAVIDDLSTVEAEVRAIQQHWRDAPQTPFPEEAWFTTLTGESAAFQGEGIAFVFRDPFGQRFGWRWRYAAGSLSSAGQDWRELLHAHLMEELDTGGWSVPDENGVRWLVPESEAQPAHGAA